MFVHVVLYVSKCVWWGKCVAIRDFLKYCLRMCACSRM